MSLRTRSWLLWIFTAALVVCLYASGEVIAAAGMLATALFWTFIDWISGTFDDEKRS